jgi:hypothetical protein
MKRRRFSLQNLSLMRSLLLPAVTVASLAILSCSHTVTVTIPPVVRLGNYQAVGLVEFVSQPPGQMGTEATRKFIDDLHAAQPGIRILEIGSEADVMKDLGYDKLDFQSIKAIGDRFGIAAVLTGTIELSEPQSNVMFGTDMKSLSAGINAKVDGRMSAKLWETGSGATLWSNSSWGSWTVGGVSLSSNGSVSAGYNYPGGKQDEIITELVNALNGDFWPRYEKRKVEE